jgi:hypothetical protein
MKLKTGIITSIQLKVEELFEGRTVVYRRMGRDFVVGTYRSIKHADEWCQVILENGNSVTLLKEELQSLKIEYSKTMLFLFKKTVRVPLHAGHWRNVIKRGVVNTCTPITFDNKQRIVVCKGAIISEI